MQYYKADLHIHSVLSPCADLSMSPKNIIHKAKQMNIDFIALTDHNSAANVSVTRKIGLEKGVIVLPGMEVNTKEEVHCLVFFKEMKHLIIFQEIIDLHKNKMDNDEERFGYQLIVDENENILGKEKNLLWMAVDMTLSEISKEVKRLDGMLIPAHIYRPQNGLINHMGFVPDNIEFDGLELENIQQYDLYSKKFNISCILNSDAHYIDDIGRVTTQYYMKEMEFEEIRMALACENGRKVVVS